MTNSDLQTQIDSDLVERLAESLNLQKCHGATIFIIFISGLYKELYETKVNTRKDKEEVRKMREKKARYNRTRTRITPTTVKSDSVALRYTFRMGEIILIFN